MSIDQKRSMPAAVVGQAIAAIWLTKTNSCELPSHEELVQAFAGRREEGLAPIPETLLDAFSVHRTLTNFEFSNWNEMIGSAFCGGCIERGPGRSIVVSLNFFSALHLISDLEIDWPNEIDWIKEKIGIYHELENDAGKNQFRAAI